MRFENRCFVKKMCYCGRKNPVKLHCLCFSVCTCGFLVFSLFFLKYSTVLLVDLSCSYKCKLPAIPVTVSKAGRLHSQMEKQCILFQTDMTDLSYMNILND